MQGTHVNQGVQETQVAAADTKTDNPSNETQNVIKLLENHGSTFNNCTFVFNNKLSDSKTTHYNKLTCILTVYHHLYKQCHDQSIDQLIVWLIADLKILNDRKWLSINQIKTELMIQVHTFMNIRKIRKVWWNVHIYIGKAKIFRKTQKSNQANRAYLIIRTIN